MVLKYCRVRINLFKVNKPNKYFVSKQQKDMKITSAIFRIKYLKD